MSKTWYISQKEPELFENWQQTWPLFGKQNTKKIGFKYNIITEISNFYTLPSKSSASSCISLLPFSLFHINFPQKAKNVVLILPDFVHVFLH